jgi:hypothetical protein
LGNKLVAGLGSQAPPAGEFQNIFPEECVDIEGHTCCNGCNGNQRLFMLKDYFGKLFFPRLHPSQYNQQFKIIAVTLSLGLIVAGVLGAAMIWRGAVN